MAMQNSKLKILYLMDILLNRTDEEHIMTATELCAALKEYDVTAERKSIYNDIAALQEYGMDIVQLRGANAGYYVASRKFELPELKLLVDAVQSSKFITSGIKFKFSLFILTNLTSFILITLSSLTL